MPSASTKTECKASVEATSAIINAIGVVDKKVRNLEKRKGKLDSYREKKSAGETLNEDQREAIARYEVVIQNLEFARELQKQFIQINTEYEKLQKKQTKRDKIERAAADQKRNRELLQLQNILDSMGTETIRADFTEGKKGALQLTVENLSQLDEFYPLISPARDGDIPYNEQLVSASEHLTNYLDSKEKEVVGTTYKELRDLVERINTCPYWEHKEEEEEVPVQQEEVEVEVEEAPEPIQAEPEQKKDDDYSFFAEEKQDEGNEKDLPQEETVVEEPVMEPSVEPFNRQRQFQEIVSSVQGTFDFLQDSEIEADPAAAAAAAAAQAAHLDPAVVAAKPMATLPSSHTEATHSYQSSLLPEEHSSQHHQGDALAEAVQLTSSQHTQQAQSALVDSYSTSQDYNQDLISQGLSSTQQMFAEHGLDGSEASMNQASQEYNTQDSQEKKPFTMNPNAAMFQSMYGSPGMSMAQAAASSLPSTQSSDMPDSNKDMQQGDYQGGFGNNYRGGMNRGRRDGQRGGRGMSNGFSNRGGSGNRGGNNQYNGEHRGRGSYRGDRGERGGRGGFQGYPPRSDYRPEGGYQGYNNGFTSGGYSKRGGSGGMRGGGPPRGSGGNNMRGARGGGFGRPQQGAGMQQTA